MEKQLRDISSNIIKLKNKLIKTINYSGSILRNSFEHNGVSYVITMVGNDFIQTTNFRDASDIRNFYLDELSIETLYNILDDLINKEKKEAEIIKMNNARKMQYNAISKFIFNEYSIDLEVFKKDSIEIMDNGDIYIKDEKKETNLKLEYFYE